MAKYSTKDYTIADNNLHKNWSGLAAQFGSDSAKYAITTITGAQFKTATGESLPIGITDSSLIAKIVPNYSTNTAAAANYGATTLIGTASASGSAGQVIAVATTVTPSLLNIVVTVNGLPISPTSGFTYSAGNVTIVSAQTAAATINIYLTARIFLTCTASGTTGNYGTGLNLSAASNLVLPTYFPQGYQDSVSSMNWGYNTASAYTSAGMFGFSLSSNASAISDYTLSCPDRVHNPTATQSGTGVRQGFAAVGHQNWVIIPQMLVDGATYAGAQPTGSQWNSNGWAGGQSAGTAFSNVLALKTNITNFQFTVKNFVPAGVDGTFYLFGVQKDVLPKRLPALIVTQDDAIVTQYDNRAISQGLGIPVTLAANYCNIKGVPTVTGLNAIPTGSTNFTETDLMTMLGTDLITASPNLDVDGVRRKAFSYMTHIDHGVDVAVGAYWDSQGATGSVTGASNGLPDYVIQNFNLEVDTTRAWMATKGIDSRAGYVIAYPANCWESRFGGNTKETIISAVKAKGFVLGRSPRGVGGFVTPIADSNTSTSMLSSAFHVNCNATTAAEVLSTGALASEVLKLMTIGGLDVILTFHGIVLDVASPTGDEIKVTPYTDILTVFSNAKKANKIRCISFIEYASEKGYLGQVSGEGYPLSGSASSGGLLSSLTSSLLG
jgi:hypothetical protein